MSVFFLGASNCILNHSWVGEVEKNIDEPVVNESLGSSPSRFGLYCLARIAPQPSDVIILDYTVTEGIYQAPVWNFNENTIAKDIASLADYLYRRGCYVIMMINPCFLGIRGQNVFENTHINIARSLGMPILNITELFRQTMALGLPAEQLMMDNSHHASHTADTIAEAIVYAIQVVRRGDLKPKLKGQAVWVPRVVDLAPMIESERRLKLDTRIRKTVLAPLNVGETLLLDVETDEYILGMVVNMAGAGARVRIEGNNGVEIRDLIYDYSYHNRNDLMGLFVPMRTLIEGSAEGVVLRVAPFEGEAPEPEIQGPPKCGLEYNEICIEGVLIGSSSVATCSPNNKEDELIDLLETRYDQYAQDLFTASHGAPLCEFSY